MRLRDIQLEQCGLLKSKKKPQRIFFNNFDACLKMEKVLDNVSFIFKVGDDLRQVNKSQVIHAIIFFKKGLSHDPNAWGNGKPLEM